MNKLIFLIPIVLGIAAIVSLSLTLTSEDTELQSKLVYENDFAFYDVDKIKTKLAAVGIKMTSPVAITDNTIGQYCTYFDDDIQKFIKYCTTTALLDSDGNTFGNINLGGTIDGGPIMALAIVDSTPFLDSNEETVDSVFQTMIETLVCDCWQERQPGGFASVQAWINAAEKQFAESDQNIPLKSTIDGLDSKQIILEIASKDGSYLWSLIVLK